MIKHALLSASSSHKWLNCTPSARLEENMPDRSTEHMEAGSLAHEIGELKLRKAFVEPLGPRAFNARLKKLQAKPRYEPEMLKHTDTYVDYISKIAHSYNTPPYVAVEKRIDYSAVVPEGFGTGDCTIIGGDTLYIIDFKYGKGVPVSADHNPQMMLYALGVYLEYSFLCNISRVKMAIVQPRLDDISEFEMTVPELLSWAESIKPIAQTAYAGEGERKPGEWCRFCKAKDTCRARSDSFLALTAFGGKLPPLLTNDEIGPILVRAKDLAKWAEDLKEYALSECLQGREIPGWKAVHGRGARAFINTDDAFKTLTAAGYQEELLYKREPLSVAKIEELLGKKTYKEILSSHVNTPPGKPTLVTLNDKRDAITSRPSAAEDFGEGGLNG